MSTKVNFNENEAQQFVTENINVVPKNQMKKFNSLKLEDQVKKIQFYFDIKRLREDGKIKNSVPNKVKELFEHKKATIQDAKDVIKYCSEFIDGFKQREIEKLDAEIAKLQAMKQSIL